jgi:hypothetical protein
VAHPVIREELSAKVSLRAHAGQIDGLQNADARFSDIDETLAGNLQQVLELGLVCELLPTG